MDDFLEEVTEIVNLEEEIRLAPPHLQGTQWLNDRLEELRIRYQFLQRLWPIHLDGEQRPRF